MTVSKAADRWTWLTIIAYTQLRQARGLTPDLRRPGERPATQPRRLAPPASGAAFATSARNYPFPPARRNPSGQDSAAHPAPEQARGRPPTRRQTQLLNQTATTKPIK